MRWWAITCLAVCVSVGCHREEEGPSATSGNGLAANECAWRSAPQARDAEQALCGIEFREVTRLVGELDGAIPQYPVTVLRDGRYVTATYSRGKLALWAPDGRFLGLIGTGAGQGPGEFVEAADFAQLDDDELLVFTGLPIIHRYSTSGRFLRSLRLPTAGGAGSAVTYEDAVLTSVSTIAGAQGFVLRGDSIESLGLLGSARSVLLLAAADDIGVWSANHGRYVLRRHSWPSGAVVDSVVPVRDWFPGPEGNVAQLGRLHADGRGLVWTLSSVADPDAPSGSWPPTEEVAFESEMFRANNDKYRDTVIEAFASDGRLVASIRFDSTRDSPDPVSGSIWFRPTEDMLTFVILEAVLTEPGYGARVR